MSFDLEASDLDIILLTDPRPTVWSSAYQDDAIHCYRRHINPEVIVIHRINECDQRKRTQGVNERLAEANACADHTVFVSQWLKDLFWNKSDFPRGSYSVIRNGADTNVFHAQGHEPWRGDGPLKIVTHHWGGHLMKGFDIYERLDSLLADTKFKSRFQFTYVGNLPKGFQFQNARYVQPKNSTVLANELRTHHVYLTASRNEPGSHHQNEGACCGLPLLYRESGCLPEYCIGFGISFSPEHFEAKLEEMLTTYEQWAGQIPFYPHTAERCCEAYVALFRKLLAERKRQHVAQST